jgi:hypothetical protein
MTTAQRAGKEAFELFLVNCFGPVIGLPSA